MSVLLGILIYLIIGFEFTALWNEAHPLTAQPEDNYIRVLTWPIGAVLWVYRWSMRGHP